MLEVLLHLDQERVGFYSKSFSVMDQSLHSFNVPVSILDSLVPDVHHMTMMPLLYAKVNKRSVFGTSHIWQYSPVFSGVTIDISRK